MKRIATNLSVGVRALRDRVSAVLRQVKDGQTITITDRNRPVALLVPIAPASGHPSLQELVKTGRLAWSGGKPSGTTRPPAVRGRPVSDAVVEDRR